MITAQELIAKVRSYHPNLNEPLLLKAYIFSKASHGNQTRHSGELYFSHPLAVAEILAELKLDQSSIITALLHDVVEDTEVTLEEIEKMFGDDVAKLVDGVTKLGKIGMVSYNEQFADNLRKLTLAMSNDIRVLFVKLADRLHNMRTINYVPSREKKIKKARECLDIYAPLAGRIGLNQIKDELQALAFEIIDLDAKNQIEEKLNELREKNKNLIEKIIDDLHDLLKTEGMQCEVSGREKKSYSIWTKMKKTNIGFYNLNDIMAFRIVTENIGDCYRALGIVNSQYSMIPLSFRDYISTPKENGYRSLHLAILGPFNKKIEIQIRDKKIHEFCELGVAAHWRYKEEGKSKPSSKPNNYENQQYQWIRELVNLLENSESSVDAIKDYKLSIHQNEVFCFTPNGDVFNLQAGATVIDFAYAVHSEVGNHCIAAKVNGILSPLRQKLENGDQIEIITSKQSKPSSNWLQFVVTSKAKSAIKNSIRHEKFEEYSKLGQAILTKYFSAKKLEINEKILEKTLKHFRLKTVPDLWVRVAEGIIPRQDVLKFTYPDFIEEETKKKAAVKSKGDGKKKPHDHSLPINGLVSGMAIHYAGCCNPVPGDPIVGVINTGTGVTIHNQTCRNYRNLALLPQRVLDVYWKDSQEFEGHFYPARIRVSVENKPGSLADITSAIAKKNVNIRSVRTTDRSSDCFEIMIDIDVKNIEHLEDILQALRVSRKMIEVARV